MDQATVARRTRTRSFGARSDKSADKQGPASPGEIAEKTRRDSLMRGESKANPNAAISEAQPQARNVMEKVTLDSLRNVQHKDAEGNVITEPDLSNPTRPRWERPLDTIRSFERAIDGGYKRRSVSRAGSDFDSSNQYASRRSSYFGGTSQVASQPRHSARRSNSQYAGNESGPSPSRNSNYGHYAGRARPDSYYDQYGQSPAAPPRQRYGQRGMSDSTMTRSSYYGNGNGMQSHNPYNDASGSDSTGPWHNSTDPSSENSSLDRVHGTMRSSQTPEPMNNHGLDGFGNDAIMEEGGSDDYGYPVRRGPNGAPPVPTHSSPPRKTIQLGGGGGSDALAHQGGQLPSAARVAPATEKRKSWLGRKLSSRKD